MSASRAAILGARELAFGIAGNEQERAQSHFAFRDAADTPGWSAVTDRDGAECLPLFLPMPTGSAFARDIAPSAPSDLLALVAEKGADESRRDQDPGDEE